MTVSSTESGGQGRLRAASDGFFRLLYPGRESFSASTGARREVRALAVAMVAALVACVVGLIAFHGEVAIWGPVSPGSVGLVLAGLTAAAAAAVEYARSPMQTVERWPRWAVTIQKWINTAAIALVHAGTTLLFVGIAISILVRGFEGMRVDVFTGTMIVTVLSAVTGYAVTLSAGGMTALRLSNLFAVFVSGGVVVAMLTTSEADWWTLHFSELGTGDDFSGHVFNGTLVVGGLLLASLASFMAPVLDAWADAAAPSRTRNVHLVAWSFVVIGVCLAGVGLVPVNVSLIAHNTFATGMAVVFGALLIGLRWLLDGFSRSFMLFSDVILLSIAVSAILFWPMGYLNLTGFELVAAGIISAWLVIFLRHLDASTSPEDSASAERPLEAS